MPTAVTKVVKDTFGSVLNTKYCACVSNLRHWPSPSKRWPVSQPHMVLGCPASLSHKANDRPTHYRFVLLFDLGGLLLGQSSPKGEMTCWPPRSTILQNFIALRQLTPEISVISGHTDTQTDQQ